MDKSIQYFRNYIHQSDFSDSSRYHSALVRIADAYFVLKNDSLAIENYQKSLDIEGFNHSYALYQLSTSQGLIHVTKASICLLIISLVASVLPSFFSSFLSLDNMYFLFFSPPN